MIVFLFEMDANERVMSVAFGIYTNWLRQNNAASAGLILFCCVRKKWLSLPQLYLSILVFNGMNAITCSDF